MKHFTPLENHYKITIDEKVYPGALYVSCCSSRGINNQCLPYNPEMYEPSINNNSEYERFKYVGTVVKYNGKKWVAGIKWPAYGGVKESINLTRVTIFGNIKNALVAVSDVKFI